MRTPGSMKGLEELGRVRLSKNFFFRDFLFSEIANFYAIPNMPEDPGLAIEAGRHLCEELLEPLQATFGRLHLRSGYRCAKVNEYGNKNNLNCSSNANTAADHIWDRRDAKGFMGATACVVFPWLIDNHHEEGDWRKMVWWIHDHLPCSSIMVFPKLWAMNIQWHEKPARRIRSFAEPRGVLTKIGMPNNDGDHSEHYTGFPALKR